MTKNPTEQISATKRSYNEDEAAIDVGHGQLYSPEYAIKISTRNPKSEDKSEETESKTKMVVGLKNLSAVKEKVLEKLAAAAVPSEALENARQFLESVVRDVASAAQGLTKDALHRIKTHLVDILPSLSPATTRKMIDDAEKEVDGETDFSNEDEGNKSKEDHQVTGKSSYASPTSSFLGSLTKPFSRL